MLQARVLLCLSLAAVQVWAQADPGSGSNRNDTSTTSPFECYQGNPWWTSMSGTSGDACYIALQMRKTGGLSGDPSNSTFTHAENAQLCLSAVYDMYGACLACMEPVQPRNSKMPSYARWANSAVGPIDTSTTSAIVDLAPDWAKSVDFSDSTWDMNKVLAAASPSQSPSSSTASGLAPPNPSTSPSTAAHKSSNVGPIVGGVIGGLALISIVAAALFFYFRLQRSRKVAPSSEFTRYIQPGGTQMSTRPETALSGSRGTIPRQDSATIPLTACEDEVLEAPPAFTAGQYTGPIFEKDGYRADPNAPLYSSGNTVSQPSQSQNSPEGPSGSAV